MSSTIFSDINKITIEFITTHGDSFMIKRAMKIEYPTAVALALYTANQWSSDQEGNGLALLSFGTTRKVHSDDHRQQCLVEIGDNIRACEATLASGNDTDDEEVEDAQRDIIQLRHLQDIVNNAPLG